MLRVVVDCAVCSKTLWIGRLNKHTTEQELSSELSQFGDISSINVSWTLVSTVLCHVDAVSSQLLCSVYVTVLCFSMHLIQL